MSSLGACLIRRRRRALCLLVTTAGLLCPAAGARPLFARDALAEGCAVVAGEDRVSQTSPHPGKGAPSEALRPPQERELEELGGVLKALASAETSGATLAALGKGQPFSLERFGVLVADVRSVVVQLNARELRGVVLRTNKLDAETRQWIEQSVQVMEGCGTARFENRGGPVVFEQVVALVGKHRGHLEPLVFPSQEPQPSVAQQPIGPKAAP